MHPGSYTLCMTAESTLTCFKLDTFFILFFSREIKDPYNPLSAVVPRYFPYWIQIPYLTRNKGATRIVYKDT